MTVASEMSKYDRESVSIVSNHAYRTNARDSQGLTVEANEASRSRKPSKQKQPPNLSRAEGEARNLLPQHICRADDRCCNHSHEYDLQCVKLGVEPCL